tara:strand:- start:202 stop:1332 length:1131 start_codon:yes stop_codon:yes gene_type:complete
VGASSDLQQQKQEQKRAQQTQQRLLDAFFLPDLCNTRAVLILLAVSEGLVLALNLMEGPLLEFSWQRFSVMSLFVQWVCLLSVAGLCQLRALLVRLSVAVASVVAVLFINLVTFLVSLSGELQWPLDSPGVDWPWLIRNLLICSIFAALALRYFYVQSQWRLKAQAELTSRLAALQANIRPHFFFNTLNTVASLIMVDPDKAETMLLDLAQLFRAVLKNDNALVSLAEEIELGRRYLDIEQVRLGDRLQVEWQLPGQIPPLKVPQLVLQPLLENAVYHGIQPNPESGTITVCLEQDGAQRWQLSITNTLPAQRGGRTSHQGNGIAHANIRARLQAQDEVADLRTEEADNEYRARLLLPQRAEGAEGAMDKAMEKTA